MENNDKNREKSRDELRQRLQKALEDNDAIGFAQAYEQLVREAGAENREALQAQIQSLREEVDAGVLAKRSVRQLTSAEKKYYQALGQAMASENPQQALANMDVVMPETVIDAVFENLTTEHPLLGAIDFQYTGAKIKTLMNKHGYQEAVWGELCDEIVKELASGFEEVDAGLKKLSAFIPVCKAQLDLGPEWLDRYVRAILGEAIANGLQSGILNGDGKKAPIGMTRQVGEGVTVTGGVYPKKKAVKILNLNVKTIGALLSRLAVDENGKTRPVEGLLLIVNVQDYFEKVMPATTILAPDGTYRNNVTPYPMQIIPVPAGLGRGEAVLGIGKQYFAAAGMNKKGKIEYSDHAKFLEDKRVYLSKLYANGMPKDNNAFLLLDISELKPLVYKAELVEGSEPSTDATLSALTIGGNKLSPDFSGEETSYTASTSNESDTVTATANDIGATVEITVNEKDHRSGAPATWNEGSNTVKVTVTAEDGTSSKEYTVTVTKSGE